MDIDEANISFGEFIKMCYYFVDCMGSDEDYIHIIARIFCKDDEKLMVDGLVELIRGEMGRKLKENTGPLLKAMTSNFILLGIIDGNGLFDTRRFKQSYR